MSAIRSRITHAGSQEGGSPAGFDSFQTFFTRLTISPEASYHTSSPVLSAVAAQKAIPGHTRITDHNLILKCIEVAPP